MNDPLVFCVSDAFNRYSEGPDAMRLLEVIRTIQPGADTATLVPLRALLALPVDVVPLQMRWAALRGVETYPSPSTRRAAAGHEAEMWERLRQRGHRAHLMATRLVSFMARRVLDHTRDTQPPDRVKLAVAALSAAEYWTRTYTDSPDTDAPTRHVLRAAAELMAELYTRPRYWESPLYVAALAGESVSSLSRGGVASRTALAVFASDTPEAERLEHQAQVNDMEAMMDVYDPFPGVACGGLA